MLASTTNNETNNANKAKQKKIDRLIWKVFTQFHGLTLKQDATKYLRERLQDSILVSMTGENLDEKLQEALNYIATTYKRQPNRTSIVSSSLLEGLIDDMLKLGVEDVSQTPKPSSCVHLLNASSQLDWMFSPSTKQWKQAETTSNLAGTPTSRTRMYLDQMDLLRQNITSTLDIQLSTIKCMKGQWVPGSVERKEYSLFGMLSKLKEGEVYLEDGEDDILLCLDDIEDPASIYGSPLTECSFVLVRGCLCIGGAGGSKTKTNITSRLHFKPSWMSAPPPESRQATMAKSSFPSPFKGSPFHSNIDRIKALEGRFKEGEAVSMIVVEECWLDSQRCMDALGNLLKEKVRNPPACLVLMGPFLKDGGCGGGNGTTTTTTTKTLESTIQELHRCFKDLSSLLSCYKETKIIIQPSAADAFDISCLPRPSLPDVFLHSFKEAGLHCEMASSPARISFFSKEVLIYCEEISMKLKKENIFCGGGSGFGGFGNSNNNNSNNNSNNSNNNNNENNNHIDEPIHTTLLAQAHLSPLPMSAQPIAWEMNHVLRMYPLPDILIIGERSSSGLVEQGGEDNGFTLSCSPGSFATGSFSYLEVFPLEGRGELRNFC